MGDVDVGLIVCMATPFNCGQCHGGIVPQDSGMPQNPPQFLANNGQKMNGNDWESMIKLSMGGKFLFLRTNKKNMKKIVLIKWSVALIALVAIAGLSSCANSTGTRGITHHPHQHTVN